MPTPSVGRIVHYVSYGTPGGEFPSACRAAVIADVKGTPTPAPDDSAYWHYHEEEWCSLVVLNPQGVFFDTCKHDENQSSGTWHWPERAPNDVPPADSGGSDA